MLLDPIYHVLDHRARVKWPDAKFEILCQFVDNVSVHQSNGDADDIWNELADQPLNVTGNLSGKERLKDLAGVSCTKRCAGPVGGSGR
jgi:hypothetical protein